MIPYRLRSALLPCLGNDIVIPRAGMRRGKGYVKPTRFQHTHFASNYRTLLIEPVVQWVSLGSETCPEPFALHDWQPDSAHPN